MTVLEYSLIEHCSPSSLLGVSEPRARPHGSGGTGTGWRKRRAIDLGGSGRISRKPIAARGHTAGQVISSGLYSATAEYLTESVFVSVPVLYAGSDAWKYKES